MRIILKVKVYSLSLSILTFRTKNLIPNQEVVIEITNIKYNNKSVVFSQEIRDLSTGVTCSTADVTFVLLHSETGKPETISEEFITRFEKLKANKNA